MSVIVNFAMFPLDKGAHMSPYVATVVEALDASGVDYRLGPMGTTFEVDDMPQAMQVITAAHDALAQCAERIYCTVSIDSKPGSAARSRHKVEHVQQIINKNHP